MRRAWLVRAAVAKTRRARWVMLPDDLFATVVDRLPAREDRDPAAPLFPGVTADRLRMAISRACRDAGVPHSRHTRFATAESASCTGKAARGRRSANSLASGQSSLRQTATRTRCSTIARSTGRDCSSVSVRCVPPCLPRSARTADFQGRSGPVPPTSEGLAKRTFAV